MFTSFIVRSIVFRGFSCLITAIFLLNTIIPSSYAQAVVDLPVPGAMIKPSQAFVPVLLKGLTLHPEDPMKFTFLVDEGQADQNDNSTQQETQKLIKYFMAALTVPAGDFWVNLSPIEPDRIIPEPLSKTQMGRDMLGQDYILKQLTASLMDPNDELGKKFWDRVYTEVEQKYGVTDIPMNTFNKIWIMPDHASVYEQGSSVVIAEGRLKVMMEGDYQMMKTGSSVSSNSADVYGDDIKRIIRETIVPAIEREVNEGKYFAPLRQIYYSLILSDWYKDKIKNSLLSGVYTDQNKVSGIDDINDQEKTEIYNRYVEAYKKGVFSYIKEDYDAASQQLLPRSYFSGGIGRDKASLVTGKVTALPDTQGRTFETTAAIDNNSAMLGNVNNFELVFYVLAGVGLLTAIVNYYKKKNSSLDMERRFLAIRNMFYGITVAFIFGSRILWGGPMDTWLIFGIGFVIRSAGAIAGILIINKQHKDAVERIRQHKKEKFFSYFIGDNEDIRSNNAMLDVNWEFSQLKEYLGRIFLKQKAERRPGFSISFLPSENTIELSVLRKDKKEGKQRSLTLWVTKKDNELSLKVVRRDEWWNRSFRRDEDRKKHKGRSEMLQLTFEDNTIRAISKEEKIDLRGQWTLDGGITYQDIFKGHYTFETLGIRKGWGHVKIKMNKEALGAIRTFLSDEGLPWIYFGKTWGNVVDVAMLSFNPKKEYQKFRAIYDRFKNKYTGSEKIFTELDGTNGATIGAQGLRGTIEYQEQVTFSFDAGAGVLSVRLHISQTSRAGNYFFKESKEFNVAFNRNNRISFKRRDVFTNDVQKEEPELDKTGAIVIGHGFKVLGFENNQIVVGISEAAWSWLQGAGARVEDFKMIKFKVYPQFVFRNKALMAIVDFIRKGSSDSAMLELDPTALVQPVNNGGIDMNEIGYDRQGQGGQIQFDPAAIQRILDQPSDRYVPVMIEFKPVTGVLQYLGFKDEQEREASLARAG